MIKQQIQQVKNKSTPWFGPKYENTISLNDEIKFATETANQLSHQKYKVSFIQDSAECEGNNHDFSFYGQYSPCRKFIAEIKNRAAKRYNLIYCVKEIPKELNCGYLIPKNEGPYIDVSKLDQLRLKAQNYRVPLLLIFNFGDGLFYWKDKDEKLHSKIRETNRPRKDPNDIDPVYYIPTDEWKKVSDYLVLDIFPNVHSLYWNLIDF